MELYTRMIWLSLGTRDGIFWRR